MGALVLGEVSGWLIAAMVLLNASLPYLLRGRVLAPRGWALPYLERMRPHYWIGSTVAGLGLLHAGFAMSAPVQLSGASAAGLWIATGGMLLAFGQVALGLQLRTLRGQLRLRLRKTHFRVMAVLVAIGIVHVALNGVLVRGVLGW